MKKRLTKGLNSLKNGVLFGIGMVVILMLSLLVYASIPTNTWVNPNTLEATSGDTLTSDKWNSVLKNLAYLNANKANYSDIPSVPDISSMQADINTLKSYLPSTLDCNGKKRYSMGTATYVWSTSTCSSTLEGDPVWNGTSYTFGCGDISHHPAFKACTDLGTGWRLATIGELSGLNNEPCLANINGIATYIGYYWSSNEISSNYAEQICLYLSSGSCGSSGNYKYDSKRVICTKNL